MSLPAQFAGLFGRAPDGVWAAPGRVNLIGEHTDYNDGFVLPLALPQRTRAAVARRDDGLVRVRSRQDPDGGASFQAASVLPGQVSGWPAYAAGVVWALRSDGHRLPGVDMLLDGDVPVGAGLSSSASLECAVAVALDDLAGLGLDRSALALAAQRAENDFVGVPCGVMDQMASMHGRAGHVLFLDTRSLQVTPVPFDLAAYGLALLVVDTRAPHRLVDGEYAARRRTCEQSAAALGVRALRDVTVADLDGALARLPDEVARRRVRHVVTEDARVLEVVAALRSGADPRAIGPALTASHASMRDDFEITVPEVDAAVESLLAAGAYGARMTGGGFGGCVLGLLDAAAVDTAAAAVQDAFGRQEFTAPASFVAVPADGAGRVA